jgi:RNA polymerase sigma-70 factor (ECF subfamily)
MRTDTDLKLRMTAIEKTLQESSDSALMLSYSAGDDQGFEMLYERHKNGVYRFFYFGTGGDESLAGELFLDVWMTVVRGRKRFHKDISFTEWLHHVAWARLYDHIRLHPLSESQRPEPPPEVCASNVVTLHTRPQKQDSDLLNRLEQLSDEHREIVLLRYCFRMSYADIANFLDVARSSVSRLHKEALSSLRQERLGIR